MMIYAINNSFYYGQSRSNLKLNNIQHSVTKPSYDSVTFSGLFRKTKTEELNSDELITSYKMADVLHRLDKDSMLVIGDHENPFTKARVKAELISHNSFLPAPKNIKDVYFINTDFFSPIMIARKNNGHFFVFGDAKNLTNPKKDWFFDDGYRFDNSAGYNDIIKTGEGVRLKFIKTKNETNKPMYDAKYPVESFLSEGDAIRSGLILNSTKRKFQIHKKSEGVVSSDKSEYSKAFSYKTFDDIAGMDETIDEMKKRVLYPLLYPEAFLEISNCGTILYGPPGTGKTLLAQAILGEAKKRKDQNIHFINIDAQSLTTSLVGQTEAMWRDVFKEAVDNQPSIIFIDEIDAILSSRMDDTTSAAAKYCNNVVSQFLTLISDIEKRNDRVYIIGATNRPEAIDAAIKRKGRLGHMIEIKKPDEKGCLAILNHYLKNKNVSDDFDKENFAKEIYTLGYTGADIANLVNIARDNMYERCGIYEKMEAGTFEPEDLNNIQYTEQDFEKSLT